MEHPAVSIRNLCENFPERAKKIVEAHNKFMTTPQAYVFGGAFYNACLRGDLNAAKIALCVDSTIRFDSALVDAAIRGGNRAIIEFLFGVTPADELRDLETFASLDVEAIPPKLEDMAHLLAALRPDAVYPLFSERRGLWRCNKTASALALMGLPRANTPFANIFRAFIFDLPELAQLKDGDNTTLIANLAILVRRDYAELAPDILSFIRKLPVTDDGLPDAKSGDLRREGRNIKQKYLDVAVAHIFCAKK